MSEFRKISLDNTLVTTNKSFLISRAGLQSLRGQLINIPEYAEDKPLEGASLLNTPVIDNLVFQAGSYLDLKGNKIDYDELRIDAVVMEVSMPRNIVKTSVQGRDSVVKEFISDNDFLINIRGIINNTSKTNQKVYPLAEVQKLVALCKAKRSLVVTSTFLNEVFGINDIVIEHPVIPQVEGLRNQQPFSISASSDVPIDLEELEID